MVFPGATQLEVFNYRVGYPRGRAREADDPRHAACGAQRGPVVLGPEVDEEVAGKHGLGELPEPAPLETFHAEGRAEAVESLTQQVLLCTLVLARFALHEIPGDFRKKYVLIHSRP
ncbi:hypothetical protein D3C84_630750 [compost metagenome]